MYPSDSNLPETLKNFFSKKKLVIPLSSRWVSFDFGI
jgi:hypothetical protein